MPRLTEVDEENDAKLIRDMVLSIREWRRRKVLKDAQIRSGHYR